MTAANDYLKEITEYPTYTFLSGVEVQLKGISPFLLQAFMSSDKGKPIPPLHEIREGRKNKLKPNFADETYQEELNQWELEKNERLIRLLVTKSIVGQTEDYLEGDYLHEMQDLCELAYGSEYNDSDLKYIWVTNELLTVEDFEQFQEAVQQLTMPTENAIQESSKSPTDSD